MNPMSDERLAEIEAAEAAASPGPWFVHPESGNICHGDPADDRDNYPLDTVADDEFIVLARAAVPELVAELRRARELLRNCRDAFDGILFDEKTIEAGLWRGDYLPRRIREIDAHLGETSVFGLRPTLPPPYPPVGGG